MGPAFLLMQRKGQGAERELSVFVKLVCQSQHLSSFRFKLKPLYSTLTPDNFHNTNRVAFVRCAHTTFFFRLSCPTN